MATSESAGLPAEQERPAEVMRIMLARWRETLRRLRKNQQELLSLEDSAREWLVQERAMWEELESGKIDALGVTECETHEEMMLEKQVRLRQGQEQSDSVHKNRLECERMIVESKDRIGWLEDTIERMEKGDG